MTTEFRAATPQCIRPIAAYLLLGGALLAACAPTTAPAPPAPVAAPTDLPRCDAPLRLHHAAGVVATTPAPVRGSGPRAQRAVAVAFTVPALLVAQAALPCALDDADPRRLGKAAAGVARRRAARAMEAAARACLDAFATTDLRDADAARDAAPCGATGAGALWGMRLTPTSARLRGAEGFVRVEVRDEATGALAAPVVLRLRHTHRGWRPDGDALVTDAARAIDRARDAAAWTRWPAPPDEPPVFAVGDVVRGAIEPGDPRMGRPAPDRLSGPLGLPAAYDVYEVHVPAGRTVALDVDGLDGFDPLLALAPPDLLDLAELPDGWWQDDRDAGGGDLGASVTARVDEAGRYRVYVSQPIAGDFGRYELRSTWR